MNTIWIALILLVALWLVIRSTNIHLKQQKLLKVREMLHKERVKSLETDAEPIDINFELESMAQMMSQSVTTSTTFMRIWHQVSFRLAIFFIALSLMGLILLLIAHLIQSEVSVRNVRAALFPLLLGIPMLVTNFISTRYLK
jgi:ABC-type sugar transport system permease subunit